jgi:hypothetical protein
MDDAGLKAGGELLGHSGLFGSRQPSTVASNSISGSAVSPAIFRAHTRETDNVGSAVILAEELDRHIVGGIAIRDERGEAFRSNCHRLAPSVMDRDNRGSLQISLQDRRRMVAGLSGSAGADFLSAVTVGLL